MSRVEIELIPWGRDSRVEPEDARILVLGDVVEIDGEFFLERQVQVAIEDRFVMVTVENPTNEMRARYSPEQFLEGTNESRLVLPVTELVIR